MTHMAPIVLIADEHALVREGMKALVKGLLERVQFAEATDWDSLMGVAHSYPTARLALIDLSMPGIRGGIRLFELAHRHPEMPLVLVSPLRLPTLGRRITGFHSVYAVLRRSTDASTIRLAIEAAIRREKFVPTELSEERAPPLVTLTPRGAEILDLLRRGMSNKMIASTLGISPGTVKNHITDIFRRLNATNRTQAAHAGFDAD